MPLIIHIVIALGSVAYATYLFAAPTKQKFVISYISVAFTLVSGCYLVALSPSHMAEACLAGLLYTGVMLAGIVASSRKLAKQRI